MDSMFDTLLLLPLFQGLAQEDFTKILGKVKLHFTKHKKREVIAAKGSPCRELIFVLKGEVSVTSASDAPAYSLTETLPAPWVIEPQSLFGMQTAYAADYLSTEETSTISIDKLAGINELFKYDIFRLNYMNMVSNRAQQLYERLWRSCTGTLEERIAAFMLLHAERPCGPKLLKIHMKELAGIVNCNRTSVSTVLKTMQEKGWLTMRRGEVDIPQLEKIAAAFPPQG